MNMKNSSRRGRFAAPLAVGALLSTSVFAQSPPIKGEAVIGAGGGGAISTNFRVFATIGGPSVSNQITLASGTTVDPGFIGIAFGCDTAAGAKDCDWDSIPNAVEPTVGRNTRLKDNDVFTQDRLFVMQMYRDAYSREADALGLAFWLGALTANATDLNRVTLARQFLNSGELDRTQRQAARLYFATFGRIGDTAGLRFWAGQLAAGALAEGVAEAFVQSGEFVSRYGQLSNNDFVDRLHRNIFGRSATSAEIARWVNELEGSAPLSRGALLIKFLNSEESRKATDTRVDVTVLYTSLLHRAPDDPGLLFWVNAIDSGTNTINGMISGIFATTEYRARFLPT
jgi:hypothetical protein